MPDETPEVVEPKGSPENPMTIEEAIEAGIDVEKVQAEAEVLPEAPAEVTE